MILRTFNRGRRELSLVKFRESFTGQISQRTFKIFKDGKESFFCNESEAVNKRYKKPKCHFCIEKESG